MKSVLVANRGEIAVRVARAAADVGWRTVMVFSEDDADAPHVHAGDRAVALDGAGPRAYLSVGAVVDAAVGAGCGFVHPGYGFLSESAELARACAHAGLTFVGPSAAALDLLGDKLASRALARRLGVAVPDGSEGTADAAEVARLLAAPPGGAVVIKAVAGGGGRGMRVVTHPGQTEEAWARCRSEAESAFGRADVYVERFLPGRRHVEVQVVADAGGGVVAVGDRECSLQRRHQKLVELAPAPHLPDAVRAAIHEAALALARAAGCANLATFEFLVDADDPAQWCFIEANPRLQVEHTVTEEAYGVDLVQAQLLLADGAALPAALPMERPPLVPEAMAVQLRVNAEEMAADGSVRPGTGVLTRFDLPGGPGVRIDTAARVGTSVSARFDPLLAKLIVRLLRSDTDGRGPDRLVARAARALSELVVEGVPTNRGLLTALLARPEVAAGRVHTGFVDEKRAELLDASASPSVPIATGPSVSGGLDVCAPLSSTVVSLDV
ncbi:MAG TPA: biotin carboxylase N-terminal domain-containing protein, partial [Acidimicrobiales bacterium]|nr:biotin carboxylase N-terminal domain-containing protein [Acidimicrobiales bacterium]